MNTKKIADLKAAARDARNIANIAENAHLAADAVALSLRLAAREELDTAARKVLAHSNSTNLSYIDDSINALNKLYAHNKIICDTAESAHVKSAADYAAADYAANAADARFGSALDAAKSK